MVTTSIKKETASSA